MRLVEFNECEIQNDRVVIGAACYINPDKVEYLEEVEPVYTKPFKTTKFTYVGLDRLTTIVEGAPNEVKKKLEQGKWLRKLKRLS